MPEIKFDAKKELDRWLSRIVYDVRFKDDTKANLSRLDELKFMSLQHFVTIAANTEPLVYKIVRYFIETGALKNDDICLMDGQVVQTYIGDDSAEWRKKERVDDFFKIFGPEMRGRWVCIPLMEFDITVGLAVYFMSQFRLCGALGLIVYADGVNNLVESMTKGTNDPYFVEFPNKRYRKRRRTLPDDEW